MQHSPSLDVIMSLAANEAVAADFDEIRPEHVFMALLKYSELNPRQLRGILGLGQAMDALAEELDEIKRILTEQGIDSTGLRREIRKKLGRGGRPGAGLVMRPSRAVKDLVGLSEEAAKNQGLESLTPAVLLRSMLARIDSPSAGPGVLEARADGADGRERTDGPDPASPDLGRLTQALKGLRTELLNQVIGQDHAVHAFVEGLFNAEVAARGRP